MHAEVEGTAAVRRNSRTKQFLGEIIEIKLIAPHQMKNGKFSRWLGLNRIVQQATESII